MVVMCEQSCPVLLNEALKNYEIEIIGIVYQAFNQSFNPSVHPSN